MGPIEIFNFAVALVTLAALVGFGLMFGLVLGIKAVTYAFGPININRNTNVRIREPGHD